ncbi:putative cellulose synthase (UDP-forming) [Medicago truncatula]|uniref:Cellulose synthase-like protein D3 n=1 Tax=Medicago truncatula TaxID=3880 RepID=G7IYF6_MEDTR|nr:cellulose synthase-like protein G3 [Medicago truncatula]AES68287.1 cellulose synthase-like protein D3 [Medicago truncatula]RHN65214.1 putative cellulose synthase (UDP-forming) [Medicago truncatula]
MTTFTLHKETVQSCLPLSRLHIFFHFICVLFLFYYRINNFIISYPWILMTLAELILSVLWFFNQAYRWRPVSRSVMVEKLPADEKLPGLDIFVCTIDPEKEPTVEVMNTVVSAIAMDYPSNKLSIYLSDDGASAITLFGIKEATQFAKVWVPFCKKYGVKSRCPKVFFSPMAEDEHVLRTQEFEAERDQIKVKYEKMEKNIEKFGSDPKNLRMVTDRPSRIEIINEEPEIPRVVYVSRERRPSLPHKFKGGALNTLLRVSGLISNGPYVLAVDCDMYCNDPSSAKQAMCFFLDPETSKYIAFVQFPQMFHNLSKKDIYDNQSRTAFKTMWQGMDGLRGPGLSGTGNYLNRSALLFGSPVQKDDYLLDAQNYFGKSTTYIESLKAIRGQQTIKKNLSKEEILREAQVVASSSYESNTKWGTEIGFSYGILLESTITGYLLHSRGWKSAYLYPKTPCFLGCAPTDIKEGMLQLVKWLSELCLFAVSKYSPFTYGFSRMSAIHNFTYCFMSISSIYAIGFILYGIVPQVCFLKGIPVFPKVTDPWFAVFAFLYVATQIQHLIEVISGDGSVSMWWDEQRIWILKSVTSLFAMTEAVKKWFGLNKKKFNLSNKAIDTDKEKIKKYEQGRFDFQGAALYMSPMVVLLIVNTICFFGGLWRLFNTRDIEDMFGQLFLVSYVMALSYPIFEGIITMKSKSG